LPVDDLEEFFGRIRTQRFTEAADPFRTIHEEAGMSGNMQPSGWYAEHSFSSFVGQANVLLDPTFETVDGPGTGGGVTVGTTQTKAGLWACHYVLNSGSAPSTKILQLGSRRGYPSQNPLNSGVVWFALGFTGGTACNADFYLYPDDDYSPTYIPTLEWLVAGVRVYNIGGDHASNSPGDIEFTLQILKDGAVVDESASYTYDTAPDKEIFQLISRWTETDPDEWAVSAYRWRLKMHIDRAVSQPDATYEEFIGEPQLHFNYQPEPLPFLPLVANWFMTRMAHSWSLGGDITPSQITGNTDNYNPTDFSEASILRIQTDASREMTGMARGADGQIIILANVGSFDLVMKHETTSTAANRFLTPNGADFTVRPNESAWLFYDDQSLRWRVISSSASSGSAVQNLAGVISPTISADQNNYNPTGLGTANVIRITATGATRTITGIAAQPPGRVLNIFNVGSETVNIPDEDGASTDVNRVNHAALFGIADIRSNGGISLWYDGTSSRWRVLGQTF
jgi:hypothetical protein